MTIELMKIKSKNRRDFKIGLVILLGIFFINKWITEDNSVYLIISLILAFVAIIEIILYTQTFLELTENHLKVKRKGVLNFINEEYQIELKDIQSTYYEKKIYDNWELYHRLIWELFFPSGQSFLIVNLTNGKSAKIPFDGNENELIKLKNKLPDSIPI